MTIIHFTSNLEQFFDNLSSITIEGNNIKEVLLNIEKNFNGISNYILDDNGSLRQHVNIFINNQMIEDRTKLTDTVKPDDEIYIMQALSGG